MALVSISTGERAGVALVTLDDRGARLCQPHRARSTDTRARARDDCDAIAQADEFVDGNYWLGHDRH